MPPNPQPLTRCSAPGKIILFGEHAVVYGFPALAAPVTQVQATATVMADARPGTWIDAPEVGLSSELSRLSPDLPLVTVIQSVFSALGIDRPPACTVHIESTIPVASGLGSGAAVSVAVIRALSSFIERPLSDEQVNSLAFEVERLYHGTPSGIDNTVITYARPVFFVKGQPIEPLRVGWPFTIVIGDSGIPSPTKETVGDVRRKWEADPQPVEKIFDQIGVVVHEARQAIEIGNIPALGSLMDENHALLREMGVSSAALDRLTEAARKSGALGAKLSGGGRGGNMIAVVSKEDAPAVADALMSAGARRTIITHVT
ncbi:MAG: mevalonate kinase [Chloroflexi bacterium]|nr:mevalonate kinase [Chloroflexota bacterium]